MKIAICAGHREDRKGAVNKKHGLNEYDEADKVIPHLISILINQGYSVSTFSGRLSEKITGINEGHFDLALDLHFNAGGGRGCEVIHVPRSSKRHDQAEMMSQEISLYMNLRDRGARPGWHKMDRPGIVDYPGDEDGDEKPDAFVTQTNCPAFIPEPLFIDNNKEVEYWLVAGRHEQIAQAIANGIEAVM
jgi:N-acetylmuramoyl-L-alanine amidase